MSKEKAKTWIAWLEKQGEKDVRYEYLDQLLAADDIYQMAISDGMVQEAKTKAINALCELEIGKLLGIKNQGANSVLVTKGNTSVTNLEVVSYPTIPTSTTIKPKFHFGDYLVNDYCKGKVIALTDGAYLLDTGQCIPFSCEHNAHLWTIQDAKDGDVLAFKNNIGGIIICKSPTYYYGTRSYCRLVNGYLINKEESGWASMALVPATKEQRDLLFQKMKKAGYEWSDKDRRLIKIVK